MRKKPTMHCRANTLLVQEVALGEISNVILRKVSYDDFKETKSSALGNLTKSTKRHEFLGVVSQQLRPPFFIHKLCHRTTQT